MRRNRCIVGRTLVKRTSLISLLGQEILPEILVSLDSKFNSVAFSFLLEHQLELV